jgi:hypothetical protein
VEVVLPKPTPIATYVSAEVAQEIGAAAAEEGLSRAAFVRRTLVKELVARTRRAQGLPPTIEDAVTLAQIASILRAGA